MITDKSFWDGLTEIYPQMGGFYEWLDSFQKSNNFYGEFHVLPMAVQLGIFTQFIVESGEYHETVIGKTPIFKMDDFPIAIESHFMNK